MGDYPAYPAYQDCGIEWLGEVPAHWDVGLIKRYFHVELGKMLTRSISIENGKTKPYLRAANIHWGRTLLEDINEMEFSPSQLSRYRVKEGDLLVTEGGVTVGRSAIWQGELQECYYQNSINRVRPRTPISASPYFLFYWMYFTKTNGYIDLTSNIATFGHLTQEKLQSFPIVMPPLVEQQAIARFLDLKTAQIDALIAAKQALLEKLAEKRTALISHAVTKGLDPDVPMKDSGIAWLGEIPAHWEFKKLKYLARIQSGLTLGKKHAGDTVTKPYLRVANVQDGYLDLESITTIDLPPNDVERYRLQPGDVLMTEGGDFDKLGRGYVWEGQIKDCLHQNHVFAVRPSFDMIDPYFLAALTSSQHGKNYFTSSSQQTTNLATINQAKLNNFPVPLPSVSEQQSLLQALNSITIKLDQQSTKIHAAIDKLQEYRTALITHAVTGKIDVRNVPLPDAPAPEAVYA